MTFEIQDETKRRISKVVRRVLRISGWLLLACLALNFYYAIRVYHHQDRFEIGPVANDRQSLNALWPYGLCHQFMLDVPGVAGDQPPVFTASIQFLEGKQLLTNLVFYSTNARPSHWPVQDAQSFSLIPAGTGGWLRSLPPGRRYSINCDFQGDTPSNCTLWVWCMQNKIDWPSTRHLLQPTHRDGFRGYDRG